MKLFQHSSGMIIAFGFDMIERKPNAHRICWSDGAAGEWAMKANNMAGWNDLPYPVSPEFIHEARDGSVVAYQPGSCIVMMPLGAPLIWSFTRLAADNPGFLRSAA